MAELVLLSFDRREFNDLHRRAGKGDQDALKALEEMWAEYEGVEIACFLCDAPVQRPPFTMVLPEHRTRAKVVAAPLCVTCRALPQMIRLNRCLSMLRKMYSASSGRQVHFSFNKGRR